jgi:hypothetical protein
MQLDRIGRITSNCERPLIEFESSSLIAALNYKQGGHVVRIPGRHVGHQIWLARLDHCNHYFRATAPKWVEPAMLSRGLAVEVSPKLARLFAI